MQILFLFIIKHKILFYKYKMLIINYLKKLL